MAVYDRAAEYLRPGDYVMFSSQYGKPIWLFVEADEPLGQMKVQMTEVGVSLAGRAARAGAGSPVPPFTFIDAEPVRMDFLEPRREDRLYQIRPSVFAIDELTGHLIDEDVIPPLLMLEWDYPDGTRQGGSDRLATITINNIPNPDIGGPRGGRIPVNEIYNRSDLSPLYDIFVFFLTAPAFRLINWTRGVVGDAGDEGLQFLWFLTFQGRKYIFRRATAEEEEKLNNRELPYRSMPSPGGVPDTLLRRD